MAKPKRPQKKKENARPYRTLFLIAVEGETEQCYFQSLNSRLTDAFIMASTPKTGSSPKQVGEHIDALIEKQKRNPRMKLRASDQAWVVIDRDNWPEDVVENLFVWADEKPKTRGVALSNPNFEFWVLLHFTPGNNASTADSCRKELAKHLPHYEKANPDQLRFTKEQIATAISHAKARLAVQPSSLTDLEDVPLGYTSMGFLMERLLPELKD